MKTLPDYLQPGLDIIFVGINPGFHSAEVGHYFATGRNRFWPAFNAAEMTPVPLGPETDDQVLRYGIGFTDVVKRPTRSMSELKAAEFNEGAEVLLKKMLGFQPRLVCFNGISGYNNFLRYTEGVPGKSVPGLQERRIGHAKVFVLPSTSPANAGVPLVEIVRWMKELRGMAVDIKEE